MSSSSSLGILALSKARKEEAIPLVCLRVYPWRMHPKNFQREPYSDSSSVFIWWARRAALLLLTAELYKRVQPWNRISLPFVWLLVAIHGSLTRLNRWECHHSLPILRNSCCIWFIVGWLVELLWVCHSGNQAQTTQILMWLLDEYVGCWSRPFCYLGQKLCNKRKRVILKPTCGPNQIHIH